MKSRQGHTDLEGIKSNPLYMCPNCGRDNIELEQTGCKDGPCPLIPISDKYQMTYTVWERLFIPMKTVKYWRQFAVYTVTSVLGMMCTRYIPAEYWPYWFAFSLFIGHVINLFNYAGFKIRWNKKKK